MIRKNIYAAILFGIVTLIGSSASAEITERRVEYRDGTSPLIGYFYSDSTATVKLPAVLVFSDWMGIGEFAKDRAKRLVGLGYSAFVADIYGGGHQAKDQKEAGELATKFKSDRKLMRARAEAGLRELLKQQGVDSSRIGAMGFCFGGTVSLELARVGAPVAAIISFHGGLSTPDVELAKNIKGKVLVLHGADDPYVPADEVSAFESEMRQGKVNWELVSYGNSVHSFTNPAAGNDNSKGAAYNKQADQRSFEAMKDFFREVFGG